MNQDDQQQIPEQKKAFLKAFLKVWKMKKDQSQQQQNTNQEEIEQQTNNEQQPKSQVFSREEYAKDQFWEDRYKEHKGQFDWYVEWPELKHFLEETQLKINKNSSILMVGCGNSALSEQMYNDGYHNIVSIDISKTIIDRMQEQAQKKQMNLIYQVMDATQMEFQDKQFDIAFDKGTLDALSCGGDDTKNLLLLKEMNRVAKEIIIVSHSSHTKRINIIEKLFENKTILETRIKLSGQAELINIIRTRLKDKPLSYVLKDKEALVSCINEYKASQKLLKQQQDEEVKQYIITKQQEIIQEQVLIEQQEQVPEQVSEQKQEDENLIENTETQQVEQQQQQQQEEQEEQQEQQVQQQEQQVQQVNYDPRRQSHCYIYKIL